MKIVILDGYCENPGDLSWDALAALDDRFIAENLSPGGSADLLALTYLLHFITTEGNNDE